MRNKIFLILIIFSLVLILPEISEQAHAQSTISLDKKLYDKNDVMILTGTVTEEFFLDIFTMSVKDPFGEKVFFKHSDRQLKMTMIVDENGDFDTRLLTEHFMINGNYTIEVDGMNMDEPITVNFEFTKPNMVDVRNLDKEFKKMNKESIQLNKKIHQIDKDVKELQSGVSSLQIQFNNFQTFVNEQLAIIFNMFNTITSQPTSINNATN